jgi:hypothetical protein
LDQDNSQYLTAKSSAKRTRHIDRAYWKVRWAMVLLIGVLVFVFYQFSVRRCCSTRRMKAVRAARRCGSLEVRYAGDLVAPGGVS